MHARSAICLLILLIAALLLPAAGGEAEVVGELGCAGGAGERCRPLADPGTPADDSGTALAGLGSPGAPVDDLAAALERLAVAGDPVVADAAQAEALAILEGTPLARRAYSGIPLLNWNAPAKLRTVPAGGTVEISEVRFPATRSATRGCWSSPTRRSRTRSATGSPSWAGWRAASSSPRRCWRTARRGWAPRTPPCCRWWRRSFRRARSTPAGSRAGAGSPPAGASPRGWPSRSSRFACRRPGSRAAAKRLKGGRYVLRVQAGPDAAHLAPERLERPLKVRGKR